MNEYPLSPRAQRLRDAGYKLTHARLTILKVLEDGEHHLTSHEILDRVTALDPDIGRASVFRALELFTQLWLIRPTIIDSSMTPSYVLLPGGHHHHIICTQCSRVIEFEDCGLKDLERTLEQKLGVKLMGHLLEFYGLCADCRRH
jgi:Fur family ferric uptake transcriptional regulator